MKYYGLVKRQLGIIGLIIISMCLLTLSVKAEDQTETQDLIDPALHADMSLLTAPEAPNYETFSAILRARNNLDLELKILNEEMADAKTDELQKEIGERLDYVRRQRQSLTRDIERIATGVDIASMSEEQKKTFDIKDEIMDLLTPVIHELKAITETPRAIEKLKREAAFYQDRLEVSQKALSNIQSLLKSAKDQEGKHILEELERRWASRHRQVVNQLAVVTFQLDEKTKAQTNILDTSRHFFQVFFKSRGKNFLMSLLAFIVIFLLMRLLYRLMMRSQKKLVSTLRNFYFKLFNIVYYFLTFILAFAAFMAVLYMSGDWLLLSIAIIFILGLLWTAKEGLPRFSEQIKFMLNLGTVKENERLIYNGVPWLVVSLNLYSQLQNPALTSGTINLPIRHLTNMVSRPNPPEEPWFPSKSGDWVILSDQTLGKVVIQTPETVIIELRGGAIKNFQTAAFLKMNPINISEQFRLRVMFGIDHAYKSISVDDIPQLMRDSIRENLKHQGYDHILKELDVQFQAVSLSSLDYLIIADFHSLEAAPLYNQLGRAIQQAAVTACNQYNWKMPFTQLTLHHASEDYIKS